MAHAHFAQDILNTIEAQDWDAFLAITTPDLKQQVLPRSLGRPEVDRDTWLARLKINRAMIPDWKVKIRGDVISNETGVSFFATATGTSSTNLPYTNDYMVIMRLSPDDSGQVKISRFDEMLDSAATAKFMVKHQAALETAQTKHVL